MSDVPSALQSIPDPIENVLQRGERHVVGQPQMRRQHPVIGTQFPDMNMMKVAAGHKLLHVLAQRLEIEPLGSSFQENAARVT